MRNPYAFVSDPNDFVTSAGNRYHDTFDTIANADGTFTIRRSGKKDIKAEINSHACECDMARIIARLQLGDSSVLNPNTPLYGDFTQFPKTYAEAFDMVTRSVKAFESLDPDIRKVYDNDVSKWFSSIGTPDWFSNMGLITPDSSESEVID